jgi:hypothetical protein
VADVVEEFLVTLGFRLDGNSHQKFNAGLAEATKGAKTLALAATAASAAVTAAVTAIGQKFDDLYYAAKRTNSSVQELKALSYAIGQVGGSAQGAMASMENFSAKLRNNPGYASMVRQLGVVTHQNGKLRETTAVFNELIQAMDKKPRYVALSYLEALGIDEKTFDAARSPELKKFMEEYRAKAAALQVDLKETARIGNDLTTGLKSLGATAELIGAKLQQSLGVSVKGLIASFDKLLTENADTIVRFFERLGRVAGELAAIFEAVIKFITPLWEGLDKITRSVAGVDGLTAVLTTLIGLKVAAWFLGVAASIKAVGTAASLALLGGALGKFLTLFGVGGVAGAFAAGSETQKALESGSYQVDPNTGGLVRVPRAPGAASKDAEAPAGSGGGWGKLPKLWDGVKRWWNGSGHETPEAQRARMARRSSGGGAGQSWLTPQQSAELARGIQKTGADLGVAPDDLATAISYETGGTMHPWKKGPYTKWGRHRGLIQWGEPQRDYYKVNETTSITDQMEAVTKYLRDRGVKPGHGLGHIYSAINAGNASPRYWNNTDRHAGGAPGTVADKVQGMSRAHAGALSRLEQAGGVAPGAGGRAGALPKYTPGSGDAPGMGNAGITSPERAAADDQAVNDNVARMRKQAAAEDLAKAQTILDVTNFEEQLALADRNAGKATGGGLGGSATALAPPPGNNSTSVSMPQETTINVTTNGDAKETAAAIAHQQESVNGRLLRNMQTAVK